MQRLRGRLATPWCKSCHAYAAEMQRLGTLRENQLAFQSMGWAKNGRDVTPSPAVLVNGCFAGYFC
jgi:hypothetical protein